MSSLLGRVVGSFSRPVESGQSPEPGSQGHPGFQSTFWSHILLCPSHREGRAPGKCRVQKPAHLASLPTLDDPFTHPTYANPSTLGESGERPETMPGWQCGSLLSLLSTTVLSPAPTVGTTNCQSPWLSHHRILGGTTNLTHMYRPSTPGLNASQRALTSFPLSFFFFHFHVCEHSHVCRHRCGCACGGLTLMLATVLNGFKSFAHSKNSAGGSDRKQLFYETLLAKHSYGESKSPLLEALAV